MTCSIALIGLEFALLATDLAGGLIVVVRSSVHVKLSPGHLVRLELTRAECVTTLAAKHISKRGLL